MTDPYPAEAETIDPVLLEPFAPGQVLGVDDRPAATFTEQRQAAQLRTVRHQHGSHGPHDHTAADYATHQQPIGAEQVISREYGPIPRVTGTSPEAEKLIAADSGTLMPVDNAPGHTSDGFHTFDELYAHRCALTAVLATIGSITGDSWRSKQHHPLDGPMFDGYFVVGIDLPDGGITYHYPLADWGKFAAVRELDHAPKWDGHTGDDVIDRLGGFVANLRQAIADGTAAAHQAHMAADAVVEGNGGEQ